MGWVGAPQGVDLVTRGVQATVTKKGQTGAKAGFWERQTARPVQRRARDAPWRSWWTRPGGRSGCEPGTLRKF